MKGALLVIGGLAVHAENPEGREWTMWSDWAGCDHLDHEAFCENPSNYLAEAVRYRECRLQDNLHDDAWGLLDQDFSNVQPPKGDPRDIIDTGNLPGWWYPADTIPTFVANPSTRLACDPRLVHYAEDNAEFASADEVEAAIELDPEIWQNRTNGLIPAPYKNIIIERALCIEGIKCPIPLPWSSWNCHCEDGSASTSGDSNPSNLPACTCEGGATRSRVQLCQDTHREDDITCESISVGMSRDYARQCLPSIEWYENWYGNQYSNANWYSYSRWVQYGDSGYNSNLRLTHQLYQDGNYFYTTSTNSYPNQCWTRPTTGLVDGKVYKFTSTYEAARDEAVHTHWEYGVQEEQCVVTPAEWGAWGAWGGCTASCAGGLRYRRRNCVKNGQVRNDLILNGRDCDCPGSDSESTDCNTFCCPIWHTCSGTNCNDNDFTPLNIQDYVFGTCDGCGSKTLSLERHCKCRDTVNGVTTWRYGNLDTPAFSVTNQHYQHDCVMDSEEGIETSGSGRRYIARKTKVCDLPCCAGWNEWAEWSRCDDTCFDSVANPGFTSAPRTRRRQCGCGGGAVATDFSACIPVAGGVGVEFEDASDDCPLPDRCPYWAQWSNWGVCSESCRASRYDEVTQTCTDISSATKIRTRTCNFGEIGGPNCPEGGEIENAQCDDDVPFCCNYNQWTEWDQCVSDTGDTCTKNGQKGGHTRTRDHFCGTDCPDCVHAEECPLPTCAGWCEWGGWSDCSTSCGPTSGTKSRTRCCNKASINSDYCPCHATFTLDTCAWGGSTCSNYYKTGDQLANWNADVSGGFHDSDDEGYLQVVACNQNLHPCPSLVMEGDDRAWSGWNECSQSCGEGREQRSRICIFGELGIDEECSGGELYDVRTCNLGPCPFAGLWGEWSACSQSCGGGSRSRDRPCVGNGTCSEDLTQTQNCANPCPYLSNWSQWSSCSQDCAQRSGLTIREKACVNGELGDDGCQGQTYESKLCNQDVQCPSWGVWSEWTACQELRPDDCAHSRTRSCQEGQIGSLECPQEGVNQEAPCSCTCDSTDDVIPRQQAQSQPENDTSSSVLPIASLFVLLLALF